MGGGRAGTRPLRHSWQAPRHRLGLPRADGQAVKAELLTVTAEGLARMDILEGYPGLYRREEVEATLAGGTSVKAMAYVVNRLPERAKVIASGDWRNR